MMDRYEERLQQMKEMQTGVVGRGDVDDGELDSDCERDEFQPQPKKQMLKFGRAKEGTATVVEVV